LLSNTSSAFKPYIPPGLLQYYVPYRPSGDIAAVKPLQYWIFKDGYLLVGPINNNGIPHILQHLT
jgi:hypothetical protein